MDQEQHERQIALGLRDGQTDAWRALYDAYALPVWNAVARQMRSDAADVADVVQETFLAAARSARQYDPARGSLWMWLCGIARRHVALHYRGRQRRERLQEDYRAAFVSTADCPLQPHSDGPSESLMRRETADLVRCVLTDLPLDYETLLTSKYCDGMSVEELAAREECSPVAVRSKLARARRAFVKAFKKKKN